MGPQVHNFERRWGTSVRDRLLQGDGLGLSGQEPVRKAPAPLSSRPTLGRYSLDRLQSRRVTNRMKTWPAPSSICSARSDQPQLPQARPLPRSANPTRDSGEGRPSAGLRFVWKSERDGSTCWPPLTAEGLATLGGKCCDRRVTSLTDQPLMGAEQSGFSRRKRTDMPTPRIGRIERQSEAEGNLTALNCGRLPLLIL